MKRQLSIVSVLTLLLSVTPLAAQSQSAELAVAAPRMTFEVMEHDFGELTLDGRSASFDFVFVNDGTAPLVVIRTQTTCKCTKVQFLRRPVGVGEKGVITITYTPDKELGTFYKGIHIFTNSPERQQTIFVKGVVVAPETRRE